MGHIFISYSHKDKKYVEELEKKLISEGFDVWIDHRIDYGSRWSKEIQKALDTCDAFVVVMSEDAYKSKWVQNEVARADRKKKPFFPLLLRGDIWLSVEKRAYIKIEDVRDVSLPQEFFYNGLAEKTSRKKKEDLSLYKKALSVMFFSLFALLGLVGLVFFQSANEVVPIKITGTSTHLIIATLTPASTSVLKTPPVNQKDTTITAKKVCVRFGQVVALSDFSVNIPKGVVGLLGPNGSGKSTFIKTALGLVQSQSGSIRIDGHDPVTEMLTVRDMIGYMPEHNCLIGSKNAVELVSYMAQLSGMTKTDSIQRTHEVLDFVSVGEERYRQISSYSTGMMQRIKLAQAIVHDPPILFLDEPTNGMDPQGREDMLALVKKIGASDKSLLVSSHILHEVEKVSDYAVIIRDGNLIMEGTI